MPFAAGKVWFHVGVGVYALGAIALGIVGLVWGDFATAWQPIQTLGAVPHRTALAYLVAACLVLGGVALQKRKTALAGLVLVASVYLGFALLWLPRVIGYPRIYGTWGGFLEQLSLVAAAMTVYGSLAPNSSSAVRTADMGRMLFGLCVVSFALSHFFAIPQTAGMVPKWIPPNQTVWAIATGIFHLLAGLAILTRIQDVLAARLLTVMVLGFGLLVWLPSLIASPHQHFVWAGNAVNLALAGAAWAVADWIDGSRGN